MNPRIDTFRAGIFRDQPADGQPIDTISKNEDLLVTIPLDRIQPNTRPSLTP